jgi:DNA-binding NarL/FixJ family response regulator
MRILIADDSDLVRRGVGEILSSETNWEVCGEARDGSEALRKARELLPDLILLDISMPAINGLEVARLLRQEVPKVKILVISQHDPIQLLPRVIEAGGDACVDKDRLGTDLMANIKSIERASEADRIANAGKNSPPEIRMLEDPSAYCPPRQKPLVD